MAVVSMTEYKPTITYYKGEQNYRKVANRHVKSGTGDFPCICIRVLTEGFGFREFREVAVMLVPRALTTEQKMAHVNGALQLQARHLPEGGDFHEHIIAMMRPGFLCL